MKKLFTIFILYCAIHGNAQNIGIGTTIPNEKLHVAGNIKADTIKANNAVMLSAGAGKNKVLTSDSNGVGSWQASSSTGSVGYGAWGDCSTRNISEYLPVAASDAASNDNFGYSVSMDGNYAIVGAPYKKVGNNADQGKAYIFYYNGSVWVQQTVLTASDGTAGDEFGLSVSMHGNYAIVGSPTKTVGANTNQGKAYIFHYNGSAWVQQAALTASDGAAGDLFGIVSINSNYAIVGAQGKTVGSNFRQGKAYIYENNGSTWVQQAILTAGDGASTDYFGYSVSIHGSRVIVGAPNKKINNITMHGKVYIFSYNGSTWVQQAFPARTDAAAGDYYGYSVSMYGDNAIVGASGKTVGNNINQGRAYIYNYDGSNWLLQTSLTAVDGIANDFYGNVSIYGNFAMVGVHRKTLSGNFEQGKAYIYQLQGGVRWVLLQAITDPSGVANDHFGLSVSMSNNRFVIGAYGVSNSVGMAFFGKIE